MLPPVSKRIAVFVPTLRGGGAERVMVNLVRGFVENNLEVDLVVRAKGIFLVDVPSEVRLVDLHSRRALTSLPGLIHYLRREHPVAMLSAMSHANIIAVVAALIARVKTRMVVSVHSTISQDLNSTSLRMWFQFKLISWIYPKANKVITVSEAARDDFIHTMKFNPSNIKVIYNPVITPDIFHKAKIEVRHPWFKPGGPPVILGVGRLTAVKDYSTLIRAFSRVLQTMSARLLIIGEGEERKNLENLVLQLGIKDYVDLHGFVDNPYAYMARAKVFVLSSISEGLPTALIESVALGIPIIATDCPSGPREILQNGRYGTLVSVGDEKGIAECIVRILNEKSSNKVSVDAWNKFEINRVTKKYIEVLLGDH